MKDFKFELWLLMILVLISLVMIQFRLTSMEERAKDRYLSTDFSIGICRDNVQTVKEIIYRIEEADLAYKTEFAETMTKNDEYFDGLLRRIGTDIWLLKQQLRYSTEEIFRRMGEQKDDIRKERR